MILTYHGEMLLLAASVDKVTMRVENSIFRDLVRGKGCAGHRFAAALVEIGNDELPEHVGMPPRLECRPATPLSAGCQCLGTASSREAVLGATKKRHKSVAATLLMQDRGFAAFVAARYGPGGIEALKRGLGIKSRTELDGAYSGLWTDLLVDFTAWLDDLDAFQKP